jgi:hypothetical protein
MKLLPRAAVAKAAFNSKSTLFTSKLDVNARKKGERRKEKISWTDRVRNEEALHRVKEERNILHTVKRRKANWIVHILRKNCLLRHAIEGNTEGRIQLTGRRARRSKQLLDDLKDTRDTGNCKTKH